MKTLSFKAISELVKASLLANTPIRHPLPLNGRLHIDRQLPFLVVYRRPLNYDDKGTVRLASSYAAYLNSSADESIHQDLAALVDTIVCTLSPIFKAFLLVELWATPHLKSTFQPTYKIITPDPQLPLKAQSVLVKALNRSLNASASIENAKTSSPPYAQPLLSPNRANTLTCFSMGLEVPPTYRSADSLYPLVLRETQLAVSQALHKALYSFSHEVTSEKPKSYFALGRRSFVEEVKKVDKGLSEISGSFDFLLSVTPVNGSAAWKAFKANPTSEPDFRYRDLSIDPEQVKRELYNVPFEKIEDPTLARIFLEKVRELDRQLTMLAERNTHRFLYGSLQLYGAVDDDLLKLAETLLRLEKPNYGDKSVDAKAFAKLAGAHLERYQKQFPNVKVSAEIRNDLTGLLVSKGTLFISHTLRLAPARAAALLHHEIETHVLTYLNGLSQPVELLSTGLAGYEALQEGIAVLAEYLGGGLTPARLRTLAARVIAAHKVTQGASFIEIISDLHEAHRFTLKSAFQITTRVVRGGGFTKDVIYLKGLNELLAYLAEGGDFELLLAGKVALEHVPFIEELRHRQVLHPPPLLPDYLQQPAAQNKLAELYKGVSLVELSMKT